MYLVPGIWYLLEELEQLEELKELEDLEELELLEELEELEDWFQIKTCFFCATVVGWVGGLTTPPANPTQNTSF